MFFKSFSYNELRAIAERYTKTVVKENNNGTLVFTEQGARLLGMFPDTEGDNVLWVNENLNEYFLEHQALIGGERLWISPERNFYYENPRDFEGYRIPSEIDPGEYKYIDEPDVVKFESTFSLLEYDMNKLFDSSMGRRTFTVIPDPYNTNLPFAGVSITDEVVINDATIEMCGWSIAQIYTYGPESPGTALFPVKPGCALISYFDQIPPERAETCENYARFKIDGSYSCKVGIRPEDIPFDNICKAVYLSRSPSDSSVWLCVIKKSDDIAKTQDECVDMAKSDPNGPKGAVQAFNTDHGSSKKNLIVYPCGELGLQLTKGISKGDQAISIATHELLGYIGSKDEMLELAQEVLQLGTLPILY